MGAYYMAALYIKNIKNRIGNLEMFQEIAVLKISAKFPAKYTNVQFL